MNETTINGVDVSECKLYDYGICDSEQVENLNYEQNPDCYFKQCKRLQEENEELKARFNELYNNSKQLANKYNKYGGNKENELVEIINKTTDEKNKYKQALEEIKDIIELTYYSKGISEEPLSQLDFMLDAINDYEQRRIKILIKIDEVLNDRD